MYIALPGLHDMSDQNVRKMYSGNSTLPLCYFHALQCMNLLLGNRAHDS